MNWRATVGMSAFADAGGEARVLRGRSSLVKLNAVFGGAGRTRALRRFALPFLKIESVLRGGATGEFRGPSLSGRSA